jgi:Transmembrane domain of unknown function (DUF3566)
MPVDPSGVTDDDHGHDGGGTQDAPGGPARGEAPVADARAGLPPVGGQSRTGGNGSGNGRTGLPDLAPVAPDRRPRTDDRTDDVEPPAPDDVPAPVVASGDAPQPAPLDEQIAAADRLESTAAAKDRGDHAPPTAPDRGDAALAGDDLGTGGWARAATSPPGLVPEAGSGPAAAAGLPPVARPRPGVGPDVDPAVDPSSEPDAGQPDGDGAAPPRFRRLRKPRTRRRKARRGLRVRQRLWSLDPWSVFKLSALFYICVCGILLVAGTLLWNVGRSVGTIDDVESFVTRMGAYGTCTLRAEVPAGTEFEEDDDCADDEVLVGGYRLDDGTIFRMAAIGGGILVVAGSIGNVLMVVLLNLLNELTGGLRYTIVKEPLPPPGGRPRGPRPAMARAGFGRSRPPRHAVTRRPMPPADGDGGGNGGPIRVPVVEGSPEQGVRR